MLNKGLSVILFLVLVTGVQPAARAQISAQVQICGTVTVYVAATQATAGAITIGGVPYVIAAGTVIEGQENIAVGIDMCLTATLDASARIVPPSSIVLNVSADISICGTVSAYVAATSTTVGSITIGGITHPIAAGATITNAALIVVGIDLCLQASVNVLGQITVGTVSPGDGNHAPTIDAPDSVTVQVGQTLTLTISATDPDSGDTVTLEATGLPAGASASPNPATGNPASLELTFTPSPAQEGQTVTATFSANDPHGGSASAVVQISVTSGGGNHAPVLSVPGGPLTVTVGATLNFTVTASDPDGDQVTISTSSLPTGASFDPTTGHFSFTPSVDQTGQTFTITFTAADPHGAMVSAGVSIGVVSDGDPNPGPVISVPGGPITVPVGQVLTFVVTATTVQMNCPISLDVSGLPRHASFDPTTGHFSFTPSRDQAHRSFTVTFTATDCDGESSTASVTIVVTDGDGGGPLPIGGTVCTSVKKIVFENTEAGSGCGYILVAVHNAGNGMLMIEGFSLDNGTQFAIGDVSTPIGLLPGNEILIRIVFAPDRAGVHHDVLRFQTSDPDHPTISIKLKGKAHN